MSKTTKIIAALGVVAGLGVAALPAFTYAVGPSVSGDVDVYVKVNPAIAMTIVGNNDDTDGDGTASEQQYPTNPVTAGVATSTSPIGSYPGDITNGRSSSFAELLPNSHINGSNGNGFKSHITVYTNNASGYTLGIAGEGAGGALAPLTKQYTGTAPATPATIPAGTDVADGTSAWGYNLTAQSGETGGTYITAGNNALKTTNTATTGGDPTDVYYGVSTSGDQETGVYKASLIYTATCND